MDFSKITDRSFYYQDTLLVAKSLLGTLLVHDTKDGLCAGIITETEAYCGIHDKACHSYKNRRTKRNETLFRQGGTLYVYLIYGLHYCVNVVTKDINEPEAVLIRALQPLEGLDIIRKRRMLRRKAVSHTTINDTNLCNGPGKLSEAFGITKEHNGLDLCNSNLYIAKMIPPLAFTILERPRIGIEYSCEAKNYLWRFAIKNNPHVSKF